MVRFDALPPGEAERDLLTCCASRRWAEAVVAGRPYGSVERLVAAAGAAVRRLDWPDVEQALGAHPRIGDRPAGTGREAAWSRGEQSGVRDADRAALAEGNRAYEERFGHVFLICASGRSAGEMLAELRRRLGNDPEAERDVVRAELAKITELRLRRLYGDEQAARPASAARPGTAGAPPGHDGEHRGDPAAGAGAAGGDAARTGRAGA